LPPAVNLPSAGNTWPAAPVPALMFTLQMSLMPYYELQSIYSRLDLTKDHNYNCSAQPIWGTADLSPGATSIKVLICPADSAMPDPAQKAYNNLVFALNSYGGNSGIYATMTTGTGRKASGIGPFFMNSATKLTDINDGTANTLFFGERSQLNLPQTATSQALSGWAWVNSFAQEDNTMNAFEPMEGIVAHDLNQFGSQHNGGQGANFAFADGSVKFINKGIDQANVFQPLSTMNGGIPVDPTQY